MVILFSICSENWLSPPQAAPAAAEGGIKLEEESGAATNASNLAQGGAMGSTSKRAKAKQVAGAPVRTEPGAGAPALQPAGGEDSAPPAAEGGGGSSRRGRSRPRRRLRRGWG